MQCGGTPRDVAALLNRLQKEASLRLLMEAISKEALAAGNRHDRVSRQHGLAAIGSEDLMHRAAQVGAREGRTMGMHLTCFPVVGLGTRPQKPR